MDDVCILISESVTYDKYGIPTTVRSSRQVFCRTRDITRSEFYAAAAADLNPEVTLILSDYADYEGERIVEFHDALFSVIRTYRNPSEGNAIELVLERKIGVRKEGEESE